MKYADVHILKDNLILSARASPENKADVELQDADNILNKTMAVRIVADVQVQG